jgi:hypothetical protein
MNKFKIQIGNMTIEFATLQEAETYVAENDLDCEIIEFYDPTLE